MHTEYFLLTADMTVQVPVTLIVPAQTCGKSRPAPVRNPSQVETGFDRFQHLENFMKIHLYHRQFVG